MDAILVRVDEAARLLGIGRSKLYELLAVGDLPAVRIGRAVRVPVGAIQTYAQHLEESSRSGKDV